MKKYIMILLFLLAIQRVSFASPVIENVSVNPQALWIGESTSISLNCFDDENKTITRVYADITGPGIILPQLDFVGDTLTIDNNYLDRTGQYNVNIYCNNDDNQSTSYSTSFTVSKLTGFVSSVNPNPGFIGDVIEIDFLVKKDEVPLPSGVTFNITLNDQLKSLKLDPAYDIIRGWMLKIDAPSTEGIYNIKVYASHDRASVYNTSSIQINRMINFNIAGLSKNWVHSNDNITLSIVARDQGNVIDVNKNNLNIQMDSSNLNILSIERSGDVYVVGITMPYVSAGTHGLKAILNYNGISYVDTKSVYYIISVDGRLADSNNKEIDTEIIFLSSGMEKLRLSTDSTGYYSGSLPPDTYDIQIKFPQSTLYLNGTAVGSFDDPIKYFYSTDNIIAGIRNAGLFSYKVALSYQNAKIEMNYDSRNVINEENLVVFKCSNWNSGRKVCNDRWLEIGGDVDNTRNLITVNLNSLSAFVVGERKNIVVNFDTEDEKYYIGGLVKVIGLLKDDNGDAVSNATITASFKNTDIKIKTSSDNNGVFNFEFNAPTEEGNYTIDISAEEPPYLSGTDSKVFEVFKSKSITIVAPDTVKMKQGQNMTQEISIANTGQASLSNLNISLTGIPTSYYNVTNFIERLNENEENKLFIHFSVPEDADKKTYSINLTVYNGQIKQEKIFGFTIVGKNETLNQEPVTPSGKFILPFISLPSIDSNIIFIIIFAIVCFSMSIIVKKMKIKNAKRDEIKKFLFDVKEFLKKMNIATEPSIKKENNYRSLVSSQFPNKIYRDEHGKNN